MSLAIIIERGVTLEIERPTYVVEIDASGPPGPPGSGGALPPGGATGTFLRKKSATNGDADWDNVDDGYF